MDSGQADLTYFAAVVGKSDIIDEAYLPSYQLLTPQSVADAVELLASQPGLWKPFAGGTDLMVLLGRQARTSKLHQHREFERAARN